MSLRSLIKIGFVSMLVWVIFGAFSFVNAASVGVSPGGVYNENLIPGSLLEQEFIISRGNPESTIDAEVQIDAEDFADWLTIFPSTELELSAGEQRTPFTVQIDVPEDAEYGKYEGYLRVLLKNEKAGQVSIRPAIRLDLKFLVVAKEIRSFEGLNAQVRDLTQDENIVVELKIRNNGNVAASPEIVNLDVYSQKQKLVDSYSSNKIPEILPFKTQTVQVNFENHNLDLGTFVGEVTIKEEGEILISDKSIFKVYERKTESNDSEDTPFEEDDNLIDKVKKAIKDSIKGDLKKLYSLLNQYKYILAGSFLLLTFVIIFILLITDKNNRQEE